MPQLRMVAAVHTAAVHMAAVHTADQNLVSRVNSRSTTPRGERRGTKVACASPQGEYHTPTPLRISPDTRIYSSLFDPQDPHCPTNLHAQINLANQSFSRAQDRTKGPEWNELVKLGEKTAPFIAAKLSPVAGNLFAVPLCKWIHPRNVQNARS